MKTTHTHGPWKAAKVGGVWYVEDVARVFGPTGNVETIANAHLIAAAPELLKACVVAIDWLIDKGVDPNHIEAKRICDAIAKANSGSLDR